jgi:molybdopterin molybdotransferase
MEALVSVEEAIAKILCHVPGPRASEAVELSRASGCTLAEAIECGIDSPPHDKATVDGYAIVAADLAPGVAEFRVIEQVMAGQVPTREVASGLASRVMTGAPIPAGADAMVMLEDSMVLEDSESRSCRPSARVRLRRSNVKAGQNIFRRGESMLRGATALEAGIRLRPIEIGLLAELGRASVRVNQRPEVAILATGDELVDVLETPAAGQIRNSNGPLLQALVERQGATPRDLGIARDEPKSLDAKIRSGLACDMLLITGGVSAGDLDLAPQRLAALGVENVLHGVRVKPGKPLWFGVHRTLATDGTKRARLVFGLPGNAVSSLVCFELFVRPALEKLLGLPPLGLTRSVARLSQSLIHRGNRPTYHPGRLEVATSPEGEVFQAVEPLAWKGSGDLFTLAHANSLIVFPAGDREHNIGDTLPVLLLA